MRELDLAVRNNFLRSPSDKSVGSDENAAAVFDSSIALPIPIHIAIVQAKAYTIRLQGYSSRTADILGSLFPSFTTDASE